MEKIKVEREEEIKICPICKKEFRGMGAISRKDNETEICSECGTNEALAEFFGSCEEVKNMNIYKEIEQTIFDYETYITDIMIEIYKKHGSFSRLENQEVEEAHQKWLKLKSLRNEIAKIRNELQVKMLETEEIVKSIK